MKQIILFSLSIILFSSCIKPDKAPEFLRINHIKIDKVQGSKALINASAHFYNPNDVKMKLKEVDIAIHLDGKKIGTINQVTNAKVPALDNFEVPLSATFDIKDIGLLNGLITLLGGKKLKVHYEGDIKVAVYGITYKVPVQYDDEVRI